MPTYKDEKTGTWYCKFYYTDWKGQKRQKLKRGFSRQKDAKEWERLFLDQFAKNPDITFETLYQKYKAYITPRTRESTAQTREKIIEKHILPFFRDRIISEITPADVAAWQNEILQKGLSDTYMNRIDKRLKTIFKYAVDYCGLPKNPCGKAIGSVKTKKLNFWTPAEYKEFIQIYRDNPLYFTLFELLYYTGMRKGEALALTLNDIDFDKNTVQVNKTFCHVSGKDMTNPPKTDSGERVVDIPEFLTNELREYVTHLYKPDPEARLFPIQAYSVQRALARGIKQARITPIRVHDLRHSHASLLISLGASPVLVAERLGHSSADITLKTYSHLFPHEQRDIVSKIIKLR